jgi:holo-[acyl-carrier protein] synthase
MLHIKIKNRTEMLGKIKIHYLLYQIMIKSVGVDMEEISRFSKSKYNEKQSFYKKIFSPGEIKYCLSKKNPYPHFTVRFCAKEAVLKALKNKRLKMTEIEVVLKSNKPELRLPFPCNAVLSLSHTEKYAIAVVIIG